jgi:hypothetical protein
VERQVVAIWVATGGYLDDLAVEDAKRFVDEVTERLATTTDLLERIRDTGDLSEDDEAALKQAVQDFKQTFASARDAEGTGGVGKAGPRDAIREDVGWDRLSSHEDVDDADRQTERIAGRTSTPQTPEEDVTEAGREAGPVADADAPAPPG